MFHPPNESGPGLSPPEVCHPADHYRFGRWPPRLVRSSGAHPTSISVNRRIWRFPIRVRRGPLGTAQTEWNIPLETPLSVATPDRGTTPRHPRLHQQNDDFSQNPPVTLRCYANLARRFAYTSCRHLDSRPRDSPRVFTYQQSSRIHSHFVPNGSGRSARQSKPITVPPPNRATSLETAGSSCGQYI